jgi:hypothetical protein
MGPKAKLRDEWVGPFPILEMKNPLSAKLDLSGTDLKIHPVIHVSRLKPYLTSPEFPDRDKPRPAPVTQINGEDAWEVECFVSEIKATRRSPRKIVVRWKGWDAAFDKKVDATQLAKDLGQRTFQELLKQMREKKNT